MLMIVGEESVIFIIMIGLQLQFLRYNIVVFLVFLFEMNICYYMKDKFSCIWILNVKGMKIKFLKMSINLKFLVMMFYLCIILY